MAEPCRSFCIEGGFTMIEQAIVKIVSKEDLTYDEAYAVMNEIMSGKTSPTQNAAFLAALSTKSARAETTEEIAGCAAAMRDHATKVDTGMDICDKVIYLGTFSKSIAPAIRISYLILPEQLTELYRQRGRRISSTVSRMDQMVLCEFIRGGYFERHLNRMRSVYKNRHDLLLEELRDFREILRISGENAGSHILLTFQNGMTEEEAVRRAAEAGVGVYGLSRYLISRKEDTGTVLLGYATVQENQIHDAVQLLRGAWGLKFHENETN